MEEKLYKSLGRSGAASIAIGVIVLVCGLVCGIISIVNGGKILKKRSNIMF
ncbi:hypothetical protein [Lachnobacterium bovis]|jgi:hypothetical protein|uniref:Uncharacterized protein n=1 Tax=Lachnobacterium bovis DSM 14045 TaxID=1122142 RepID=A0A1H3GR11_9FIRM|nr:hypothetical protein [Lachnobacterium bovis]MBQ1802305.1 hypothetical protein [Lachnobacterium sp.]SDY05547.1 hypothetical protein SAMN02910414_00618 [Lachnobacterium bovis DSM 14045]